MVYVWVCVVCVWVYVFVCVRMCLCYVYLLVCVYICTGVRLYEGNVLICTIIFLDSMNSRVSELETARSSGRDLLPVPSIANNWYMSFFSLLFFFPSTWAQTRTYLVVLDFLLSFPSSFRSYKNDMKDFFMYCL